MSSMGFLCYTLTEDVLRPLAYFWLVPQICIVGLNSQSKGVCSYGKPGKVMEFHFLFSALSKSWKLIPDFGKFIKVMEMITYHLAKPHGSIPLFNSARRLSSMKIEIDLNFFVKVHEFLASAMKTSWKKY